jgi:adenylate kinase family enzyme
VAASVVMVLVEQSLKAAPARVVLLDGFPRSLENVEDFLRAYNNRCEGVLFFSCPEQEMVRRIIERGKTSGRADDAKEETAWRRVQIFRGV